MTKLYPKGKICSKCKAIYPATKEYFYGQKNARDNLHPWCKECMKNNTRISTLKKRGLQKEDYKKMIIQQKYRCLICGISEVDYGKRFSIDHNHKTNKIRGLLCSNCNSVLGYAKDNPLVLINAAKFLLSYN